MDTFPLTDAAALLSTTVVLDQVADSIYVTDAEGRIVYVNPAFERLTGYARDEAIGQTPAILNSGQHPPEVFSDMWRQLAAGQSFRFIFTNRLKDGGTANHGTIISPIKDSDGHVTHYFAMSRSVDAQTALKHTIGLQAATIESTADAIHVVRRKDRALISYNQRFLDMWGIETPPPMGQRSDGLFDIMCAQVKDAEAYRAANFDLIKDPYSEGTHFVELKDGRVFEVYSKPQFIDGQPVGRVWSHRDVTRQHIYEAELMRLASHDALTGLLNRRRLQEELEAGLNDAELAGGRCSLLLLDIDHFKEINDALGHHAGDDLLRRLAKVLDASQPENVVARFGGDEFAVFLRGAGRELAFAAAERITSALKAQSSWEAGAQLPITVSIGVAVYPDNAINVDELCSHADLAMYDAKTSGRNRISQYSPRLQQRVLRFPRDWRDRIHEALEQERLELHEQPIVDTVDGSVVAHELLVRLRNEDGSVIAAKHFIPFAEQSGLIQGIDQWVARHAIKLAKRLQDAGKNETLGFNLSRWAFVDPDMLEYIRHEIESSKVDTSMLLVEMTETSALSDVASAQRFMQGLRGLGIRFALDDFGVGYSSFHHLKRLPIDFLKIDGSFVRDLTHNRADREIVASMVKLAEGLDMKAIAEAVHSEAVLNITREIGVHLAQGYHIARPRPAELILDGVPYGATEPELLFAEPPDSTGIRAA